MDKLNIVMKKFVFLCLITLLLVVTNYADKVGDQAATNADEDGEAAEWDYYKLAIHWPYSFCSSARQVCDPRKVKNLAGIWTIHGLWPTNSDDHSPDIKYCHGEMFNRTAIGNYIDEIIKVVWPSFKKSSDFQLWQDELNWHGVCSGKKPLEYLIDTYTAFMTVSQIDDIGTLLGKGGIYPGAFYEENDIYAVLNNHLGVQVQLSCKEDSKRKKDENGETIYNFLEVYICFTKDLTMTDCISRSYCDATSRYYYPNAVSTPTTSPEVDQVATPY